MELLGEPKNAQNTQRKPKKNKRPTSGTKQSEEKKKNKKKRKLIQNVIDMSKEKIYNACGIENFKHVYG